MPDQGIGDVLEVMASVLQELRESCDSLEYGLQLAMEHLEETEGSPTGAGNGETSQAQAKGTLYLPFPTGVLNRPGQALPSIGAQARAAIEAAYTGDL